MKKINIKNQGIVTLIYVMFIAVLATFVLAIGGSRVLLSITRNRSASDIAVSTYASESYLNNLLKKSTQGTLTSSDYGTKTVGDITYDTKNTGGSTDTLSVSARRGFAVSKLQAVQSNTTNKPSVEIFLSLDCTSSMDQAASPGSSQTRFDAQKAAAISFIDGVKNSTEANFKLGVGVYGVDGSVLIAPTTDFEFAKNKINSEFGSTWATSSACRKLIDSTSVGTGFTLAQDYFDSNASNDSAKHVEIVITDGVSNSRIPYAKCAPKVTKWGYPDKINPTTDGFCPAYPISATGQDYCQSNPYGWDCFLKEWEYPDYKTNNTGAPYYYNNNAYYACSSAAMQFLACTVADTTKTFPASQFDSQNYDGRSGNFTGIRNPSTDAYSVTVFDQRDVFTCQVQKVLNDYGTPGGYFNATNASELPSILNKILEDIKNRISSVVISRVVPLD